MKVDLQPGERIVSVTEMEQPPAGVFGGSKKTEDPDMKSLLTWEPEEKAIRAPRSEKKNWLTEMRDSYRGFIIAQQSAQSLPKSKTNKEVLFNREEAAEMSREIETMKETATKEAYNESVPTKQKKKTSSKRVTSKSKAEERPKTANARNQEIYDKKMQELTKGSRWMPNSAFTTYFGKPAFANYGQGNTDPTNGGVLYGNYMKTHNVSAQEGANKPAFKQVYDTAQMKSMRMKPREPQLPRKLDHEDLWSEEQLQEIKKRSSIYVQPNNAPSKPIVKPDILAAIARETSKPEEGKKIAQAMVKATTDISQAKTKTTGETGGKGKTVAETSAKAGGKGKGKAETAPRSTGNPVEKKKPTEQKPPVQEEEYLPEQVKEEEIEERNVEIYQQSVSPNSKRFTATAYRDMSTGIVWDGPGRFTNCYGCDKPFNPDRQPLTSSDMLQPPHNLGQVPPQELNPRNYKELPTQWTQRIPAAGKLSFKSEQAYGVIFYDPSYN